jgi:hypothetical protein
VNTEIFVSYPRNSIAIVMMDPKDGIMKPAYMPGTSEPAMAVQVTSIFAGDGYLEIHGIETVGMTTVMATIQTDAAEDLAASLDGRMKVLLTSRTIQA